MSTFLKAFAKKREVRAELRKERAKKPFTWVENVVKEKRPTGQDFSETAGESGKSVESGKRATYSEVSGDVRKDVREVRKNSIK